jgi:hypothetical protein
MAKFFLHNGVIGLRKSAAEESVAPIPAGATDVISFDEASNQAAIAAFDAGYNSHSLAGGVLKRNGVTVVFAADAADKQDRDNFAAAVQNALSGNAAYLAIGSPSNAQVAAQVRALTQQQNGIIRRLALLVREIRFS